MASIFKQHPRFHESQTPHEDYSHEDLRISSSHLEKIISRPVFCNITITSSFSYYNLDSKSLLAHASSYFKKDYEAVPLNIETKE